MTTERVLIALGLAFLVACGAVGKKGGLSPAQIAQLPPEVASSYEIFSHRCSRCHTLARPLSAQVDSPEHWRLYVARMRRQPGSGISEADAEKILVFLNYYTAQKNAPEGEGTK